MKIFNAVSLREFLPSLSHLSYLERLRALELEPLELRFPIFDPMQYYNVRNNLTCIEPNSHFHLQYPPLRPVIQPLLSFQQSSNFNKNLQSSFFFRYLDCWNALPEKVRQSSSLTSFKRQINVFDLKRYLKECCWSNYKGVNLSNWPRTKAVRSMVRYRLADLRNTHTHTHTRAN